MKLLKKVLLSTTLMMGVTLGADTGLPVDMAAAQAEANAAKESAFLKASDAFTASQAKVKQTLLTLIERHTGVASTHVTVDSKTMDILKELNAVMAALVSGKKEAETNLETATGRVSALEAEKSTLTNQKAAVEGELGRVRQTLADVTKERDGAEREIVQAREAVTALETEFAKAYKEGGDTNDKVQRLTGELTAATTKVAELEKQLSDLNAAVEKKNKKAAEITARFTLAGTAGNRQQADAVRSSGTQSLPPLTDDSFDEQPLGLPSVDGSPERVAEHDESANIGTPGIFGDNVAEGGSPTAAAGTVENDKNDAAAASMAGNGSPVVQPTEPTQAARLAAAAANGRVIALKHAEAAGLGAEVAKLEKFEQLKADLTAAQAIAGKGKPAAWTGDVPIKGPKLKSYQNKQTEIAAYNNAVADVKRLTADIEALKAPKAPKA